MGHQKDELALAMRDLRAEHKNGIISKEEFLAEQARLVDFYNPKHVPQVKTAPKAAPWVPAERTLILSGLGDYGLDPETGRVIGLTPEAQARMQVAPDTSGATTGSVERFPSGAALVIGIKANGKLINKLLTLGVATEDPYQLAAEMATSIVRKGGMALYGSRDAGYELHHEDGKRWDPTTPRPDSLVLKPARDRLVGKRQVVGVSGSKGLSLIDAKTQQPALPMQIIVWYVWLQACKETKAADRLAAFSRKPRISKADTELSQKAALAMAQGTPFLERDYIQRYAVGQTRRLNMATREVEAVLERVDIGCSTLDCSLPAEPTGLPFRLYWQAARITLPEMGIDPEEQVSYDYTFSGSPAKPEACLAHAHVLAMRVAGRQRVQHVTWHDCDGEHTITRDMAELGRTDKDDDEFINQVRASYDRTKDPMVYAKDLCEVMDNTQGSSTRHQRDDDWWAAHEIVIECNEALKLTSDWNAEDLSQEDEVLRLQVAKARDEAKAKKRAIIEKLVPGYVKPGEILTKGPRKEVNHDWPTRNAKAKNSRKGGTWNRRAQAQKLDPSWRKNG